jgi:transcriptional regulator with XRE-family HTH domain
MPLRDPLAAVIRLVRSARGLAREDFLGLVDARHVYNVENGKISITLDTLETLASGLSIDPIALLVIAASYEKQLSPEDFLKQLGKEAKTLRELGVVDGLPGQFNKGALVPGIAGRRTSEEQIQAVLRCKADGMTQKQASDTLSISTSTVGRIWKRES